MLIHSTCCPGGVKVHWSGIYSCWVYHLLLFQSLNSFLNFSAGLTGDKNQNHEVSPRAKSWENASALLFFQAPKCIFPLLLLAEPTWVSESPLYSVCFLISKTRANKNIYFIRLNKKMHINFLVQNLINPQLTVIWFRFSTSLAFHHILQQAFLNTKFIYFNWRLITLQYCIGFAIH